MESKRKKIIIIGGGFAGISALRELTNVDADVTVIDKRSSQIFQPLLFQVATCNISGEDLQSPIREFLKDHEHIQFIKDYVEKVDVDQRKVYLTCGWKLEYDYLLVASGSVINFYGMEDIKEHAFSMKSARDALRLRTHILNQLDIAANIRKEDVADRDKYLTFVIAGGGATGVELCGSLMELLKDDWSVYYPRLRNHRPKVYLLEGSDCLIGNLPERERNQAKEWLEEMGIEVHTHTRITGYDGEKVTLDGKESIPTKTLIWCAGVQASPLLDTLGFEQGHAKRLVVDDTLLVKGCDHIFVAGDTAHYVPKGEEQPLPMTAAVATQAGIVAGKNLRHLCQGEPLESFVYNDKGYIAVVSRGKAVGLVQGKSMMGRICWFIWVVLHIFLPYSKHVRWSLFWKFIWNAVTRSSPYRNTFE